MMRSSFVKWGSVHSARMIASKSSGGIITEEVVDVEHSLCMMVVGSEESLKGEGGVFEEAELATYGSIPFSRSA